MSRLKPTIILERLNIMDTCEVIAMIAWTSWEVLIELPGVEIESISGIRMESVEVTVALCNKLVGTGLNTSGIARKAIFAFNKTAA